jgi:AcrR family transcriptional regulator
MSSEEPVSTRDRIITAALKLIEKDQRGPVSMVAIAKAAGLSRQALYLTFADKADLYLALVRRVDEMRGADAENERIRSATDGLVALTALIEAQARLLPALQSIANAMDVLRRQDPDAEKAWQDRLAARYKLLCEPIARKLVEEKRLRAGITVDKAADLIWIVSSFRTWDDLVNGRGWSAQDYVEHLTQLLRSSLLMNENSN